MRLNRDKVWKPVPPRTPRETGMAVAEDLSSALQMDKQAATCFDAFTPSDTEAKTEATRQRQVTQAVAWIHEGKSKYWKYERLKP